MCGIFFSLSRHTYVDPSPEELLRLKRRGPDWCKTVRCQVCSESGQPLFYLSICATVLSLRGHVMVEQPLEDPVSGSLLAWNGEGWSFDDERIGGNDVKKIFQSLLTAAKHAYNEASEVFKADEISHQRIINVLRSIKGPYALVFFDALRRNLYLARDPLGRRSLLWMARQDGCLVFSSLPSLSHRCTWKNVDSNGIHVFAFGQETRSMFTATESTLLVKDTLQRPVQKIWPGDGSGIGSIMVPVRSFFPNSGLH